MDLAVYVDAPSPHGGVVETWVEKLEPAADPAMAETEAHPWLEAARASYVLGVPRRGVMGAPVLVYGSPSDAERAVGRFGGSVASWVDTQRALTSGEER